MVLSCVLLACFLLVYIKKRLSSYSFCLELASRSSVSLYHLLYTYYCT